MPPMIRIASQQSIVRKLGGYQRFIEMECAARWNHYPDWSVNRKAPALTAFIVESNWVWRCECNEQVVADPRFPLAFCPNCLNAQWEFRARVVRFPPDDLKRAAEAVLLARPFPQNRNWHAQDGETLADLVAENIRRNVPDRPGVEDLIHAALERNKE